MIISERRTRAVRTESEILLDNSPTSSNPDSSSFTD